MMTLVIGFSVQLSGVRKIQKTEHKKQITEDKGQTVFWPPSSVC
jgi:hypothetical protein